MPEKPEYSGTMVDGPEDQSDFAEPATAQLSRVRLAPVLVAAGILIAAVAGYLTFGGDSSAPPAPAAPEAAATVFNPVESSHVRLTSEFIVEQIDESIENIEEQVQAQLRELQAQLEPLQQQLAEQRKDIALVSQTLEQFTARVDATVAEIETREQRHAARHLALNAQQQVATPTAAVRLETERKQKPPFRLAAVEYWDREPVALVLLNGRKRSLKEGDAVMTYKVVELSVPERTLSLYEAATGRHFVLEAGTNYVTEVRKPQTTLLED